MMMPANYSVIAENEMTYVVGGGLVDCLAPLMNDGNWKTFNTNLIKIIGNSFTANFVNATVATLFGGTYKPGMIIGNSIATLKNIAYQTGELSAVGVLNAALQVVGGLAAIYTLGQGNVPVYAGQNAVNTMFGVPDLGSAAVAA